MAAALVPPNGPAPKTVVTHQTPILQVRRVSRGETVGYGATWTADGDKMLATVGLGYADGFLRAASNRGNGRRRGRPAADRGPRIDGPDRRGCDGRESVKPGDEIEFLGPNMPLAEVAAAWGRSTTKF